jgi:hypothetical protein
MVAKMDHVTLCSAIFAGRCIKYTLMGYLAKNAPSALKFFGIDYTKLDTKGSKKAE